MELLKEKKNLTKLHKAKNHGKEQKPKNCKNISHN